VLFWPFLLLNWVNLFVFRAVVRERPYDEVAENLFLGFRLFGTDQEQMRELGIGAVLDVSSEFSEVRFLREGLDYRTIPVLDATPPTSAQLDQGVQWIRDGLSNGPIYVHCALGHARSATFVAAYLLTADPHLTVDDAIAHVKSKRPGAGLHRGQIASLKSFRARRDVNPPE
jgi:protein-tyrosine phosphatase